MASQHEVSEGASMQEAGEEVPVQAPTEAQQEASLSSVQNEGLEGQAAGPLLVAMRQWRKEMQEGASVGWMRQCSKHLSHIEGRMMEEGYMGHEVVRQIMILLDSFCPAPFGDWGWMLRKSQDIAVKTVRQLVLVYGAHEGDLAQFLLQANKLVRLYIEEAFHRCLLCTEVPVKRRALSSLMVTLRNLEAATLTEDMTAMSIFATFTLENVRALGMRVQRQQRTSIMMLPSYGEVMRSRTLAHEVYSLLVVRQPAGFLAMSREEVQAIAEAHGCTVDEETVLPGREGGSLFAQVFPEADV